MIEIKIEIKKEGATNPQSLQKVNYAPIKKDNKRGGLKYKDKYTIKINSQKDIL